MSIALQLQAFGVPIVGVPKTIDNDLGATLQTFGFDSAVAYATDAVDRLQTTAESHRRAIVLEVMGRHAGWIALYSGLAGGADVILIPEIPFRHEHIAEAVLERDRTDRFHTIAVVAEGARLEGGAATVGQGGAPDREDRLGGVGWAVAAEIERRTGKETRSMVLGHLQRDILLRLRGGSAKMWRAHHIGQVEQRAFACRLDLENVEARARHLARLDGGGKIGEVYGVYDEAAGVDIRGRFIIDPDFVIRAMEVLTPEVGRNPKELLRQVKAGRRFTITNRGEAIADLVPSEAARTRNHKVVIEKFQKFMDANPVRGRVNVRELIEEGRE